MIVFNGKKYKFSWKFLTYNARAHFNGHKITQILYIFFRSLTAQQTLITARLSTTKPTLSFMCLLYLELNAMAAAAIAIKIREQKYTF